MTDLVTFLRTRLDEDEAEAMRVPHPGPYTIDDDGRDVHLVAEGTHVLASSPFRNMAAHIARHTATRVLADVAAKRRHIAAVYAGHPDYREEWQP